MIVQACLNGARATDYHPALPLTADAMAADGAASVAAGAAELHIHPRSADGRESLGAVDETIAAVRRLCPGTLVGVSTGAWIENDVQKTRTRIAAWRARPDYASVNLSEPDAPAVIELLHRIGVGVEAGLATVSDAKRFITLPDRNRVFRILIEIEDQDIATADAVADRIVTVLHEADVTRPLLLHGFDDTVWHFVRKARQNSWSTRVGLEDGCLTASGRRATGNAELVADAVALFREYA